MTAEPKWEDVSLEGAFDLHVHAGPDTRPRWYSALEMAERARNAGMSGFVLKNHNWETATLAAEVRDRFPDLLVVGGIVLNRATGGFDPSRVMQALAAGGRLVWLPTVNGCGECEHLSRAGALPVVDEQGEIVAPLRRIFHAIASADAVLATGHISAAEVPVVLRTARQDGVRRFVLNHPEIPFLQFPIELQADVQGMGAIIEHCYPRPESTSGFNGIAAETRAIGIRSVVLATDLGRPDLPDPFEGFKRFIAAMTSRGFTAAEISAMTRDTPLRLVNETEHPRPD
ncbi:hypothetical protein Pan44_39300 [Caulifigura coniformis]|uniref:PHP domain protein n=1 Tax=Caulifigura coniformis TaxID=2527983 RepID=A0A517SID9_9PLAN|nr:DUF6282 family protein [Caulifigura coniformis]QDT55882.1 hypothetical protein Pan44_39300 [Caulifigura coniformis]